MVIIPIIKPDIKNILIIQLGDIGDDVLTSPTFLAIKETLPEAIISVLVRKGYGSLLTADPHLSNIIEVAKSGKKISEIGEENINLIRRLRQARYDLVIDLRTGDRGAILAYMTRAPVRVARYDREAPFWHKYAFTHRIDPTPATRQCHPGADQSLSILRSLGIETTKTHPRLWIAEKSLVNVKTLLQSEKIDEYPRFVTINPFSRWKYKEWGYRKWSYIINWLWTDHNLPTIIIGAKEEKKDAEDIIKHCSAPVFNLAGKTTLGELAALLSLSYLHLGVDSAAPHIASAVGAPTITIYGPSDWRSWTIQDEIHRIVTPVNSCVPCHKKGCDNMEKSLCLLELETTAVIKNIEMFLERTK